MASRALTGYGPNAHLMFDGDEQKWEQFECKFLAYMKIKNLKYVVASDMPASADKREEAYSELVQCLDERSLNLIMRDARDDGRLAMQILREHYAGRGTQRILSLYATLSSLQKRRDESLTDYLIRAEKAASALRAAGSVVCDQLLIAMVLKGLPPIYKPFTVVITQSEKVLTFPEFKTSIRNFEENERASHDLSNQIASVMRLDDSPNVRQQQQNRPSSRNQPPSRERFHDNNFNNR